MTREEAIEIINYSMEISKFPNQKTLTATEIDEAKAMAIKALSQEPCDAVSREAVYSILKEYHIDEEEIESVMDECQNLTVNGIASDVSLLPSVNPQPCDDAISREDARMMLTCEIKDGMTITEYIKMVDKRLRNLPPVTQKSGKWIRWREEIQRGTHYTENVPHCKCSECDTEYDTYYASRFINYCPNCGARMVEPQESEEQTE